MAAPPRSHPRPAGTTERTTPGAFVRLALAVTRRLPRTRGAGTIAHLLMRLCADRLPSTMSAHVLGFDMRLVPAEFVDRALLFYPQFWDPEELGHLRRALRPGDVFVDVGAHIGLYSLVAGRAVGPSGRVVAIEADPGTFERLTEHLVGNGARNVSALHVGVSDRDEVLPLRVQTTGNRAASSFLIDEGTTTAVEVSCRPLLEILRDDGVEQVDGAKFDIEGYEHRVLARFLADAPLAMRPRFIVTEFHPAWADRAGGNVIDLLSTYGYRVVLQHDRNYVLVSR